MIGIKDKEMPERCSACLFSDVSETSDHLFWCRLRKAYIWDIDKGRPDACPLMEISLRTEDDEACCADSW